MSKHPPTPLTESDSVEITFKSCATEVFRWMRAGIELVEESPSFVKQVSDDLVQAWHDSAKR